MIKKDDLIKLFDYMYHYNIFLKDKCEEYRNLGCNILADAITNTLQYKASYYQLAKGFAPADIEKAKDEAKTKPDVSKPLLDVYLYDEILGEFKKLPDNMLLDLISLAIVNKDAFTPAIISLLPQARDNREDYKRMIESRPEIIRASAMYNSEEILKSFIDAGVDIRLGEHGEGKADEALSFAAQYGYPNIMKMLLDAGSVLKYEDKLKAIQSGNAECVKVAIDAGVDFAHGDVAKALVYAVEDGNEQIVRMLLDAGVDPAVEGYRAFTVAYKRMHKGRQQDRYKALYNLLQATHINRILLEYSMNQQQDIIEDEQTLN